MKTIQDEILFLIREYKTVESGNPDILIINMSGYNQLKKELGVDGDISNYSGMTILIDDDCEEMIVCTFREYDVVDDEELFI